MNKSNFALISALYSNKDAGLYKDIYFPIIKYSIVCLFYSEKNQEYYDLADVQGFISNEFGIKIPLIVLKRTVQKLEDSHDISLQLYERGEHFKIKQAWNCEANVEIDQRTAHFNQSISLLEQLYSEYKKNESMEDERTFLDFITDNCEDILGYFEKNDVNQVNQEYTIMAYFLEYLHQSNTDLFIIANELFWGSIIAGFLKRENPEMESRTGGDRQEYYLDTTLVMALLDLSTLEKQSYAKELFDIIVSAGCIARIHPITIKEITRILQSVELNGYPRPNTEIASAYERRNLNVAKLASIRVGLPQLLDSMNISVLPQMPDREIVKIIDSYKNKNSVKQFSERQHRNGNVEDLFGYIHDVFMDEFIRERRRQKGEGTFFVTMNNDFITFCRELHPNEELGLIHPSKIVLEMWMHNSIHTDIKGKVMTETMARCLVMNNRDIRHKLNVVARYYNDSLTDFNHEAYRAIILGLYKRDKELITSIDRLEQKQESDNNEQSHLEMVHLAETILEKERHNSGRFSSIQEKLNNIEKKNEEVLSMMDQLQKEKLNVDRQVHTMIQSEKKNKELIELFREKEGIQLSLDTKKEEFNRLESERNKSVSLKRYYFLMSLPYVILFLAILLFVAGYYLNLSTLVACLISSVVAIAIFLIQYLSKTAYNHAQIKHKIISDQKARWEEEHSDFIEVKKQIEKLSSQRDDICQKIKTYNE